MDFQYWRSKGMHADRRCQGDADPGPTGNPLATSRRQYDGSKAKSTITFVDMTTANVNVVFH